MEKSAPIDAAAAERDRDERKRARKARLAREARTFIVMTAYLWVMFVLFELQELIVLAQRHLDSERTFGFAIVNALILAKVMLVADDLGLARGLKGLPLIYPILFKSIAFAIVILCFREAEDVLVGLWHGNGIRASVPALGGGGLKGILVIGTIIAVELVPFFAYRAIAEAIGASEFSALIFTRGRRDADQPQRAT